MLVSAVVPVFKVEDFIERCANSLFSQTYNNMEFIFVDDCSPDKSIDRLCKTIDEYPDLKDRIRIVRHEKNRGSSAARNTGIKESHGDFLFFVDADDYVERNAVALLMQKQNYTGADIVSGKAIRHLKNREEKMGERDYNSKEELLCILIQYSMDHVLWRRVIRKSLFIDNDVWMKEGTNMAEDWQVITRVVYYANNISQIDDIIYHYNSTNDNSFMHSYYNYDERLLSQEEESMRIVRDFFVDKESIYRDAVLKMEVFFYYCYIKISAKSGKRALYNIILSKLLACSPDNLRHIGWNNPIKRFLIKNYWLLRFGVVTLSSYRKVRPSKIIRRL